MLFWVINPQQRCLPAKVKNPNGQNAFPAHIIFFNTLHSKFAVFHKDLKQIQTCT